MQHAIFRHVDSIGYPYCRSSTVAFHGNCCMPNLHAVGIPLYGMITGFIHVCTWHLLSADDIQSKSFPSNKSECYIANPLDTDRLQSASIETLLPSTGPSEE